MSDWLKYPHKMLAARPNEGVMPSMDITETFEEEHPEDTLPQWVYQRFSSHRPAKQWDDLPNEEKDYWTREASAVERAVARGGFKTPSFENDRKSERTMLAFALDLAQEAIYSRGNEFSDEDQSALDRLRAANGGDA